MLGWTLVMWLSLSRFCSYKWPLTQTPVSNLWFTKLNLGVIHTLVCIGRPIRGESSCPGKVLSCNTQKTVLPKLVLIMVLVTTIGKQARTLVKTVQLVRNQKAMDSWDTDPGNAISLCCLGCNEWVWVHPTALHGQFCLFSSYLVSNSVPSMVIDTYLDLQHILAAWVAIQMPMWCT